MRGQIAQQRATTQALAAIGSIAIALLWSFRCDIADAQALDKTRLGVSDISFTFLPHLVAKDTDIFRKRSLQVELISIGGPVGTAAMAAGEMNHSASTDSGLPAAV